MDIDDPVLAKLVVDLADVRWRFDEKRDEWRRLLLQVLRDYLRAIGFDREALDPLQQLIFEVSDETDGRKPMGEASAMVFAAAAVTVLKQRGDFATIKEALAKVHKLSGLDAKALNTFRNNLSSGKKSRNCVQQSFRTMKPALPSFANGRRRTSWRRSRTSIDLLDRPLQLISVVVQMDARVLTKGNAQNARRNRQALPPRITGPSPLRRQRNVDLALASR